MEILLACLVSFAITALAGGWLILPALRRLKAGQSIREDGPKWHAAKAGTPTMGGLMFILGIGATLLVVGWPELRQGNLVHLYIYLLGTRPC